MRRLAVLMAVILLTTGCPDPREARMSAVAEPVLRNLRGSPGTLPDPRGAGADLVTVLVHANADGTFSFTRGAKRLPRGSLRFDRARARGRTTPPEYWAFVFDENVNDAEYWVPLSDPRRVRIEPGGVRDKRSGAALVRLPFEPSGWVAIFETGATVTTPLATLQYPPSLPPDGSQGSIYEVD